MKKNYLLSLALSLLVSMSLIGQNLVINGDLEAWDDETTPVNWSKAENITQEATIVHDGVYSAKHQSASSTKDFGHENITGIIEGGAYQLSYYYFDNDVNAKTRIWSKWQDDSGAQMGETIESEFSVDSPDWQFYNLEVIAPVGATQFYLEVRVYKEETEGGYVYYDDFSLTYDQTTYPEPSNYPTEFVATAAGLGINVTWAESTGSQLPSGYLVLGEKLLTRSFDVPVDGVPVENDLDWSDNKVSINVIGDVQVAFDGLETNTAYAFTIYPFTNSGTDINYKTDGSAPEATATTANLTSINTEGFDAELSTWTWTPYSVVGDQVWEWTETYGNPPGCAKMTGFDGEPFDNEDWLISPVLDLTDYSSVTFSFEQARNYASNAGLFVVVSNDYDGVSDPNTSGTWNDISSSFIWHEGGWDFIDAGTVDITSYSGATTYVAFVFTSTIEESATWELDNLKVLGVLNTGINDNKVSKLSVYPNPATHNINVNIAHSGVIKVTTITGKLMIDTEVNAGSNSINIEALSSGMYIIETVDNNGQRSIGKLTVR